MKFYRNICLNIFIDQSKSPPPIKSSSSSSGGGSYFFFYTFLAYFFGYSLATGALVAVVLLLLGAELEAPIPATPCAISSWTFLPLQAYITLLISSSVTVACISPSTFLISAAAL